MRKILAASLLALSTAALADSGPSGPTLNTIQNQGTALTRRQRLNFIGPGIVAADDVAGLRTNVTVTASGVGACAAGNFVTATNNGAAPTCATPSASDPNQAANLVKAGPVSGAAAAPTYRSLVLGDVAAVARPDIRADRAFCVLASQYPGASAFAAVTPTGDACEVIALGSPAGGLMDSGHPYVIMPTANTTGDANGRRSRDSLRIPRFRDSPNPLLSLAVQTPSHSPDR
jgi:hypothetical protein